MEKRILIVEDEPQIRELVSIYFQAHGYEVLLASTGTEGLKLYKEKLPPVVLTDFQIGSGSYSDGGILAGDIKQHGRSVGQQPIVYLMSADPPGIKSMDLDGIYQKPFLREHAIDICNRVSGDIK